MLEHIFTVPGVYDYYCKPRAKRFHRLPKSCRGERWVFRKAGSAPARLAVNEPR